jgi:hypothetical protein
MRPAANFFGPFIREDDQGAALVLWVGAAFDEAGFLVPVQQAVVAPAVRPVMWDGSVGVVSPLKKVRASHSMSVTLTPSRSPTPTPGSKERSP